MKADDGDFLRYIGLQLDSVWNVIEEHLPPLKPQVVRMLADLSAEATP